MPKLDLEELQTFIPRYIDNFTKTRLDTQYHYLKLENLMKGRENANIINKSGEIEVGDKLKIVTILTTTFRGKTPKTGDHYHYYFSGIGGFNFILFSTWAGPRHLHAKLRRRLSTNRH